MYKVNHKHITVKPMYTLEDLRHQLNEMAKHDDLSIIYPIDGDGWEINLETSLLTDGSSVTDVSIDIKEFKSVTRYKAFITNQRK
jgi:hypothetical protein